MRKNLLGRLLHTVLRQTEYTRLPSGAILADEAEAILTGRVRSCLGKDLQNTGHIKDRHGLKVDGHQEGNVTLEAGDAVLWVGVAGVVIGDVCASQVYVSGILRGTVRARTLIVENAGVVDGTVYADEVLIRNPSRTRANFDVRPFEEQRIVLSDVSPLQAVSMPIAANSRN